LRWRLFPVRFYRHCRIINGAGRELELVALTKTNLRRDQVIPAKPAKIAPRYPAPALEKGLDILELLANHPTGLTKSEVARSLDRTVSEIFRMLLCLEERGYISQSRDGERFCLTLRLFKLAHEYPPTKRMITEALPIMQQATHELNQSCHLGILDGGHIVIIAQVDSPISPGFYVKAGAIVDLMHAATGHVILAHQTPEVTSRAMQIWCRQNNAQVPRDLAAHLTKIKSQGYEERESYEVNGIVNVSCPVFDDRGNAIAAMTVPFIQRIGDQTTPAIARRVLKRATSLLSEAIGGVAKPLTSD
jgi:DNA-binding IclR family transcriptional regulator